MDSTAIVTGFAVSLAGRRGRSPIRLVVLDETERGWEAPGACGPAGALPSPLRDLGGTRNDATVTTRIHRVKRAHPRESKGSSSPSAIVSLRLATGFGVF